MGSKGKKTFKWSEQTKTSVKFVFTLRQFYTHYKKKFSNLRHFLSITFPKDSENLKSLDIGFWEMGEKRLLNGVRKFD